MIDDFADVITVANALGVSQARVYEMIRDNRIPCQLVLSPAGRRVRGVRASDVRTLIPRQPAAAVPTDPDLSTISEAAGTCGISLWRLYAMIRAGRVAVTKNERGRKSISISALRAALGTATPAAEPSPVPALINPTPAESIDAAIDMIAGGLRILMGHLMVRP